jgi:UDPglucose 6-dehydrogenase/UDP-N-acetyl-D-galactosamine dehydrogenase
MVRRKSIIQQTKPVICVVGLGYVGYPLAEAFSHHLPTLGYDIDQKRIGQIRKLKTKIHVTNDPRDIRKADYIMICVPTPVSKTKEPDLSPVCSAAKIVGQNLKKGATVVLESTVYPGVTEEIVRPILENESGLSCGDGFRIGYSPERINPGDDSHSLAAITKIVSAMDDTTCEDLSSVYNLVTNVYKAKNIQTAEAAKVIENIQRDLNIALMNELAVIFHRLGIDTRDVLEAAGTKWNFLPFVPGLVGGHCIPVDPYYLVTRAEEYGYHPQVIIAGRSINDAMPKYVAMMTIEGLNNVGKVIKGSKVLIMGLTYKENVADIRESPVIEMAHEMKRFGISVFGFDPLLPKERIETLGVIPYRKGPALFDAVILTVAHEQFRAMSLKQIRTMMNKKPVLTDVKGIFNKDLAEKMGIYYQRL